MSIELLGVGISGTALTDLERHIFSKQPPYAVVLFGRNIQDAVQLGELVREIRMISKRPPLFMIDEEGGRVHRLRELIPGIPGAEALGEGEDAAEMSTGAGRVLGLALRYFDIEVNLAPVVDVRGEQQVKGLEQRTFSDDPRIVIELAGAFMRGLHATGVASCLKHFPGIGLGSADPHYGATVINLTRDELIRRDLLPFTRLGDEAGAIMLGHGAYPQIAEPDLPASLSRSLANDLLRDEAGFHGLAISDDMEMHAVSDLGSYEEICGRALLAGNDVILFCNHIERVPEIDRYLEERMKSDSDFAARCDEALQRGERFRAHCGRLRASAPPSLRSFDEVRDESIRFMERFRKTRPAGRIHAPDAGSDQSPRTPGKGRTGREEWT
jgi:beta-N-acetylhexosaminidase